MQYKVGRVRNYKSGVGSIITTEKKYMFLDTDIAEGEIIENDDIVLFGDEDKKDRAFFVKKLERKPITKINR